MPIHLQLNPISWQTKQDAKRGERLREVAAAADEDVRQLV
jgi:hypothetical protein